MLQDCPSWINSQWMIDCRLEFHTTHTPIFLEFMLQYPKLNACLVLDYCFECHTELFQWVLGYKHEPLYTTLHTHTKSDMHTVNFLQYINFEFWVKSMHLQNTFTIYEWRYMWALCNLCTMRASLLSHTVHLQWVLVYKHKFSAFHALWVLAYT